MYSLHLFLKIVFFVWLFSVKNYAQWLVDDDGCRTPHRGVGSCVPAKECQPLVNFLMNTPQPISEAVRKELNQYTCGYDGAIKVCCPNGPIVINTATIENLVRNDLENPPLPPDITNHKNFKLLPEECGYIGNPDKIRNGKNAKLFEFPWMALLSYNTEKGPQFKCGGTILNEKYILTAAHCLKDVAYPLLGVRVGEHAISTKIDCEIENDGKQKCSPYPVQNLAIEQVIIHPGFSKTIITDDIGLLRVSKMNLTVESVRPVCLPVNEDTRNAVFNYTVVTGWGFTESYGNEADVLQKVDLTMVNPMKCSEVYKDVTGVKITYKQLCAGGKGNKDSCPGDSGGPLHVPSYLYDEPRYVQHGVVSFGHKFCGTEGYPGVYTRVPYYMDWILDNLKP